MIAEGAMPAKDVFVYRVGETQGRFIPVVGSLYDPNRGRSKVYAGVGVAKGDRVHFAPESWARRPMTLSAAIEAANYKAHSENWVDSILASDSD